MVRSFSPSSLFCISLLFSLGILTWSDLKRSRQTRRNCKSFKYHRDNWLAHQPTRAMECEASSTARSRCTVQICRQVLQHSITLVLVVVEKTNSMSAYVIHIIIQVSISRLERVLYIRVDTRLRGADKPNWHNKFCRQIMKSRCKLRHLYFSDLHCTHTQCTRQFVEAELKRHSGWVHIVLVRLSGRKYFSVGNLTRRCFFFGSNSELLSSLLTHFLLTTTTTFFRTSGINQQQNLVTKPKPADGVFYANGCQLSSKDLSNDTVSTAPNLPGLRFLFCKKILQCPIFFIGGNKT